MKKYQDSRMRNKISSAKYVLLLSDNIHYSSPNETIYINLCTVLSSLIMKSLFMNTIFGPLICRKFYGWTLAGHL